ncbi:XdhC family protein [Pseudoruegeria sp. SK021]|uniref:XdhC family protein n=1 Tax=Pseudoruegeria sp. SK021 TaxID=1933035 RepID=UPI00143D9B23|nr:XdhC family protein [Pseudoruegeria sp. SK021]
MIPDSPIASLIQHDGPGVLAVIVGVEGPSYRPVGAMMAVFPNGDRSGTLSSGCIEADIALHAARCLEEGTPMQIRYGRGSVYRDISLPCGGGLDILLLPNPDRAILSKLSAAQAARHVASLRIDPKTGGLSLCEDGPTGWDEHGFRLQFCPELRFLIFGKGPESNSFASLVHVSGFPALLLSPDTETLAHGAQADCATRHLVQAVFPGDLAVDPWTAIVLFFHDHEWEPPILTAALSSPAFYIGAQGSQRARDARNLMLQAEGATPAELTRLRGPIGLVPSARDARTLAVSVLAEVLAVAMAEGL